VRARSHRRPPEAAGSTLIEILVSIVILSFGLLGMAGLQATALRNNREARQQASAVRLATDLAERMRGNPGVALRTNPGSNPYLQSRTRAAPAAIAADCVVARCATPDRVAVWDIGEWLQRVFAPESGLPDASVTVCFDERPFDGEGLPVWRCSGTGDILQIKLGWRRASTDRSRTGAAAFDRADDADSRPSVSIPVMAAIAGTAS
jgi:type IV pilus assembly protein PilV